MEMFYIIFGNSFNLSILFNIDMQCVRTKNQKISFLQTLAFKAFHRPTRVSDRDECKQEHIIIFS